jgi:hypothetical protein
MRGEEVCRLVALGDIPELRTLVLLVLVAHMVMLAPCCGRQRCRASWALVRESQQEQLGSH